MDWRLAQAVEHLLCKPEALSSNPSPIKKKKELPVHLTSFDGAHIVILVPTGEIAKSFKKKKKDSWSWVCSSVVECLPSIQKALVYP
jgi:hypothetical protein